MKGGFSLIRVEVLNWGNFKGWQTFELAANGNATNNFSNALVAGVNGSGKSTLIDGIMTVLLPFSRSLHLGVTHDSEAGAGGGRTVKDYVLGKYSSTGGEQVDDENLTYNRDQGMSAIVMIFRHNGGMERIVSAGRVWWYMNYALKKESSLILAPLEISIRSLDIPALSRPDGSTLSNHRELRKALESRSSKIKVFNKSTAYFHELSRTFGDMSSDDLKLLNRAFYMKSVGQIDAFIRNYMLVEQPNESVDKLILNVEIAQQISNDIQYCIDQLEAIKTILQRLFAYRETHLMIQAAELEKKKLWVHHYWRIVRDSQEMVETLEKNISKYKTELPELKRRFEDCEMELEQIRIQLASNETRRAMDMLEMRVKLIEDKLPGLERTRSHMEELCLNMEIPFASTRDEFHDMLEISREKIQETEKEKSGMDERSGIFYSKKHDLEEKLRSSRRELDFLVKRNTNIPSGVYRVKEECIRDLSLPTNALSFVGELIALKPSETGFERAVEAVLFPIARNLLCHPSALENVTAWFNRTRLARGVTIKRIAKEELQPKNIKDFAKDSILQKIEVRPAKENPFFNYLWNWLTDRFYHRVVTVEEFRLRADKLVTMEGLVKSDHRTMRKGRDDFEYSLGWDSTIKRKNLQMLMDNFRGEVRDLEAEIRGVDQSRRELENRIRALEMILDADAEYLRLPEYRDQISAFVTEKERLTREDTSYAHLQKQEEEYKEQRQIQQRMLSKTEVNLQRDQEDAERNRQEGEKARVQMEELLSAHWGPEKKSLRDYLGNTEMALEELEGKLQVSAQTPAQYESELTDRIKDLDQKKRNLTPQSALHKYKDAYLDVDLPYELNDDDLIDEFIKEWENKQSELLNTELPQARRKWESFYSDHLLNSIVSTVGEIRRRQKEIEDSINEINQVLQKTDFEKLPDERRYLQIAVDAPQDSRVKMFLSDMKDVEKVITEKYRIMETDEASRRVIDDLESFVEKLREDLNYRSHVIDVRNHRSFKVQSYRRESGKENTIVETFSGARKDAKSSAQTTQLAYTLLASSLAYRFGFHDPEKGRNSLRLIILDEFGGKFDNEKPRDIVHLLQDMGFQSILVSPMTKADLLAEYISRLVLVHKTSASESKVVSYPIQTRLDYEKIVQADGGAEGIKT